MSNQVNIVRTKFESMTEGHVSYGYRLYDNHSSLYNNLYMEDEMDMDDDLEFLRSLRDSMTDDIRAVINYLIESEEGVTIDGTFYDWEEIKEVMEDFRAG